MSNSSVREALVTSVTWRLPPVRFQISHESTVPNAISPASARARKPSTLSSSHAILVPEKYGSSSRPVRAATVSPSPCARSSSHIVAVRRSCHTIAFATGLPVARSHRIVVSRWLVIPTAATSAADTRALRSAPRATSSCELQMSSGSCSTQPGRGKCCGNSRWSKATTRPSRSNTIARELVVPWSRARMTATIVLYRTLHPHLPRRGQDAVPYARPPCAVTTHRATYVTA